MLRSLPRRAGCPRPRVARARLAGTLALSIALVVGFNSGTVGLQHTVNETWIPALGVRYQLGVDGISLFLILLTALLWAGATAFSVFRMPERARIYFFMLGLAETAALGAFLAQDLLLFVLFFDLMLVPFWFLIGAFGGENRDRGDDQDDRLHARRLALDAGRRHRDGGARFGRRRPHQLLAGRPAGEHAVDRQPVLDLLLLRRSRS